MQELLTRLSSYMGLQLTLDTALIGIVNFHPENDKHFNNIFRENTILKWLPLRRGRLVCTDPASVHSHQRGMTELYGTSYRSSFIQGGNLRIGEPQFNSKKDIR